MTWRRIGLDQAGILFEAAQRRIRQRDEGEENYVFIRDRSCVEEIQLRKLKSSGSGQLDEAVEESRMSKRLFDHIDLRVKNRAAAQQFYAQVLPAIGFKVDKSGEECGQFQPAGETPVEFFAFEEEADHKPNANRIAFWAESRAAVDEVARVVREAGGKNIEARIFVEYSPALRSVFSKILTQQVKSAAAKARPLVV